MVDWRCLENILRAMAVGPLVDHKLPAPGSAAGYAPSVHILPLILPLILMLAGGGRTLEDLRVLRKDAGLRTLLQLEEMPSSDAAGDWLRRMDSKESDGLAGLQTVNRSLFRRLLRQDDRTAYTLDIDATQIVAENREARYTYKAEKGYMPLVGHIAELGLVIGHEFREGNAAPAAGHLEFMPSCERNMPKGRRIAALRADSAAYQATIFNWCEVTGKVFAIGADQDAAVKAAIATIPENAWKPFRDGEIAETVHCMNKTKKAFRLIVMRRAQTPNLFESGSPWRYHAIASNRANEDAATTMEWYSQRGDASDKSHRRWSGGAALEIREKARRADGRSRSQPRRRNRPRRRLPKWAENAFQPKARTHPKSDRGCWVTRMSCPICKAGLKISLLELVWGVRRQAGHYRTRYYLRSASWRPSLGKR